MTHLENRTMKNTKLHVPKRLRLRFELFCDTTEETRNTQKYCDTMVEKHGSIHKIVSYFQVQCVT